jgi:hypothetical protein
VKPNKSVGLRNWIAAAILTLLVLATLFGTYLWHRWPYRGREVVPSLAETFSSTLTVGSYERFYFPNPGFVAHNLVLRLHGSTNTPPLATVDTLTATGSYLDFIVHPHHLSNLSIAGLHVQISTSGTPGNGTKFLSPSGPSTIIVDNITANQSLLDIATSPGKPPLRFVIHTLTLKDVSSAAPMSYQVAFTNPTPPGELTSKGHLGPLKRADLGSTPVSGNVALTGVDLSVFHGIAGDLQAASSFHGLLSRIDLTGTTDVPNFHVGQGQPEHLATKFHAFVSGMDGSVALDKVQATAGQTIIDASGNIDRKQGSHLTLAVPNGRVQDLMPMFAHDGAPITGVATLHADAFIPADHDHFLKSLQIKSSFALTGMHFTQPHTQQTIDGFSQRATGTAPKKKLPDADAAAPTIAPDLQTQHVVLRDGIAHFTDLLFTMPGVKADGTGTFNLLNKQVDVTGTLHMDADLSDATTGIKSDLLKPIDPLFKKKHGTVAPIHLSGTYDHPTFGLALPGDRNHPRRRAPAPPQK